MQKYNLTRYHIGDKVVIGKEPSGYPNLEVTILALAPKMAKVESIDNHFWGQSQIRWLSAKEWWVVTKIN